MNQDRSAVLERIQIRLRGEGPEVDDDEALIETQLCRYIARLRESGNLGTWAAMALRNQFLQDTGRGERHTPVAEGGLKRSSGSGRKVQAVATQRPGRTPEAKSAVSAQSPDAGESPQRRFRPPPPEAAGSGPMGW